MNIKKEFLDKKTALNAVICTIIAALSFLFDKTAITIANYMQFPILYSTFYFITILGEWYVFFWIALFLMLALLINKRPYVAFIASVAATFIVTTLIKLIIGRLRPFEALNVQSTVVTTLSSFPSGHTTAFFCIIPIIGKNFPKMKITLWTIAILVGISRIYLGVHYLSDVICGAIIGYCIGWIFMNIGETNGWK